MSYFFYKIYVSLILLTRQKKAAPIADEEKFDPISMKTT